MRCSLTAECASICHTVNHCRYVGAYRYDGGDCFSLLLHLPVAVQLTARSCGAEVCVCRVFPLQHCSCRRRFLLLVTGGESSTQARRQEWLDALQEVTASFSESVCKGGLRKAPIFFYGWTKA